MTHLSCVDHGANKVYACHTAHPLQRHALCLDFQPMPNDAMTDEGEGAQAEGDVEHSAVTPQICTPKVCSQNKNTTS